MQQAGLSFEVKPATGEEIITSNIPQEVVKELSFQKAAEIRNAIKKKTVFRRKSVSELYKRLAADDKDHDQIDQQDSH